MNRFSTAAFVIAGSAAVVVAAAHRKRKKMRKCGRGKPSVSVEPIDADMATRLVLCVDAAAGRGRATVLPLLSATGVVACVRADAWLAPLVEEVAVKHAVVDDGCLLAALGGACRAALSSRPFNTDVPTIAVFISATAFRALGRQLIKLLPLARWLFAYSGANAVAEACPCLVGKTPTYTPPLPRPPPGPSSSSSSSSSPSFRVGGSVAGGGGLAVAGEEYECEDESEPWSGFTGVPNSLSLRTFRATHFVQGSLLGSLLDQVPTSRQSAVDAWLGALDLLLAIKDEEDEEDNQDGGGGGGGSGGELPVNSSDSSNSSGGARAREVLKAKAEQRLAAWFATSTSSSSSSSSSSGTAGPSALAVEAELAARAYERASGGHGFAPFVLKVDFLLPARPLGGGSSKDLTGKRSGTEAAGKDEAEEASKAAKNAAATLRQLLEFATVGFGSAPGSLGSASKETAPVLSPPVLASALAALASVRAEAADYPTRRPSSSSSETPAASVTSKWLQVKRAASFLLSLAFNSTATLPSLHALAHALFCPPTPCSQVTRKALAQVAFAHKRVLLADKVILDTVLPQSGSSWRLRSKPKQGCGCCAPDDDDDYQEDEKNTTPAAAANEGGAAAAAAAAAVNKVAAPDPISLPGGFAMAGKPRRRRPAIAAATAVAS